jgi:hypothetical protein
MQGEPLSRKWNGISALFYQNRYGLPPAGGYKKCGGAHNGPSTTQLITTNKAGENAGPGK